MTVWWRLLVQLLELFFALVNSSRKFSDGTLAWRAWFFTRILLWFDFIQSALKSFKICAKLAVWGLLLGFDILNITLNSINYTIQLVNQFGVLLFWILLKLLHSILNILDAFVSQSPWRLQLAWISFIFLTFLLSVLNKF